MSLMSPILDRRTMNIKLIYPTESYNSFPRTVSTNQIAKSDKIK